VAKFGSGDEAVVVTIEDLEMMYQLIFPSQLFALYTLNASLISSSESVSFIFLAIIVKNSIHIVNTTVDHITIGNPYQGSQWFHCCRHQPH
jgi:hypothetical protein